MADDADLAQELAELEERLNPRKPYVLPEGKPGDCEFCGEWSGRLIEGTCAPCRDRMSKIYI